MSYKSFKITETNVMIIYELRNMISSKFVGKTSKKKSRPIMGTARI